MIRPELFWEENDNNLKHLNIHMIAGFNTEVKNAQYYKDMNMLQTATATM